MDKMGDNNSQRYFVHAQLRERQTPRPPIDECGIRDRNIGFETENFLRLPILEDFTTGELANVKIPNYPPLPKEIIKFVNGDNEMEMDKTQQLKLLTFLHEINGWDIEYCDCGMHMVRRQKIEAKIVEE